MEFSELFKSSSTVEISPNNLYIASISQFRLCIRDASSLEIKHLFTCTDICSKIEWSHDSRFVLCMQEKRNLVQVFDLFSEDCHEINQGIAGVANARFAKVASSEDSFVLVNSDFQLRISVWRLSTQGELSFVTHLTMPKFDERGLHFNSPANSRMALLERREGKDYVSIYKCTEAQFQVERHFSLATNNAVDLLWSPDGRYLCVWDTMLHYKVCIYALNGELVREYVAYENALGVKSVTWSPNSQFLAIGSYDNFVRLMDMDSLQIVAEFPHEAVVPQSDASVFREVSIDDRQTEEGFFQETRYEIWDTPVQLKSSPIQYNRPNPQSGIGVLEFSPSGRYLMAKNDNIPTALFIWDLKRLSLFSVLIQMSPIVCAKWDPASEASRLCLVTGTCKMYLWSEEGCSCVDIPVDNFMVRKMQWSKNGSTLVLMDRDTMCCCYPSPSEEDE